MKYKINNINIYAKWVIFNSDDFKNVLRRSQFNCVFFILKLNVSACSVLHVPSFFSLICIFGRIFFFSSTFFIVFYSLTGGFRSLLCESPVAHL